MSDKVNPFEITIEDSFIYGRIVGRQEYVDHVLQLLNIMDSDTLKKYLELESFRMKDFTDFK